MPVPFEKAANHWVARLTVRVMSALPPKADMCGANRYVCFGSKADVCTKKNSWLAAALVQTGALLINHIALGRRTLAPFAYGASASRREATTAETTFAGWLRSQLFTAPIWVD